MDDDDDESSNGKMFKYNVDVNPKVNGPPLISTPPLSRISCDLDSNFRIFHHY